jgi:polyribonucleotide nucleotidyltransferase
MITKTKENVANIKKRSEKQEAFDRKKIENSIRNAGADEKTWCYCRHRDGLKTSEVRKHVVRRKTRNSARVTRHSRSPLLPSRMWGA